MSEALIVTLVMVITIGVPVFGMLMKFLTRYFRNRKLISTGKSAKGIILSIEQTGTYVNEQPEVKFRIRVEPEDESAFDSVVTRIISLLQIPQIQPGQTVYVKYDPNDHSTIAFDETGDGVKQNAEKMQEKLMRDNELNTRLNKNGIPATAIIMEFTDLNILVNGDNKAATLKVKVLPENGKPFDSVLNGVFMPSGLSKYKPGAEIFVKYDENDKSVVTLDFSKIETKILD